jgi:Trk K+ transport system NAD-binding subunit
MDPRRPPSDGAQALATLMAVCGLPLIGSAGAVIVEAISGGVVSRALAERRRNRTIQSLHDHFIICGYRRLAEELRREPDVTLDPGDVIVVVGTTDELQGLEDLFARAG